MWLIRCIPDPLINRRTQINHANPRFATRRGQAASKGHAHTPRAALPQAVPPRSPCLAAGASRPARSRAAHVPVPAPPARGLPGRPAPRSAPAPTRCASWRRFPAAGGGAHRPDRVPDPVRGAAGHPGSGHRDTVVAGIRSAAGGAGLDPRPPAARLHPGRRRHEHRPRVQVVDRRVRAARRTGRADPARASGAGCPIREPDRDPGRCPGRLAACPSGSRTRPAVRHSADRDPGLRASTRTPAPSASTAPSRSPTRPRWPGSRRSSTA
jgi:hypothetical protein